MTAGLTLDDMARKVGITCARGVGAAGRLASLERGKQELTRPMLVRMARQYRWPLVASYPAAPPGQPIPALISVGTPRCQPARRMLSWWRLSGMYAAARRWCGSRLKPKGRRSSYLMPHVDALSTKMEIMYEMAALGRLPSRDLEAAAYYVQLSHAGFPAVARRSEGHRCLRASRRRPRQRSHGPRRGHPPGDWQSSPTIALLAIVDENDIRIQM